MDKISLHLPLNSTSLGQVSLSILRELFERKKEILLFPIGGVDLSTQEQQIISSAVNTIDNWNTLCDQGITIALNNNPDIQYISQMNNDLKNKTNILKNATNALKNKFAFYNINK